MRRCWCLARCLHLQVVYKHPSAAAGWVGAGSPDAEVLLGVVASDIKFAARAYRDWCDGLQLPLTVPSSRVSRKGTAKRGLELQGTSLPCWFPCSLR